MLTWEKIPQLLSRIGPFQIEHPVHSLQCYMHSLHCIRMYLLNKLDKQDHDKLLSDKKYIAMMQSL